MSGLQGQTPYGPIVFGEGETMFHGRGGFMSKCLWSNGGPNTKTSPQSISTTRKASSTELLSSKQNVSLPKYAQ